MAFTTLTAGWELEETSGSRADGVGSNTLTNNNTVTSATGKVGTAAYFTASQNEYLSITDNTDVSTGDIDFAFSCWVRQNSSNKNASGFVLGKGNATTGSDEYYIYVDSAAFVWFVRYSDTLYNVATSATFSDDTWYSIVVWHDKTANTINISLNDATAVSTATTGTPRDGTSSFYIGAYAPSQTSNFWNGEIDQVFFWKNYFPDATERTWLYNSGSGRTLAEVEAYSPGSSTVPVFMHQLRQQGIA